jgi:hypothetical protein
MGTDACPSDGNRQDLVGFARISIEKKGTPTFMEGLLLQWPNPKARITCASGAVLFPDPNSQVYGLCGRLLSDLLRLTRGLGRSL